MTKTRRALDVAAELIRSARMGMRLASERADRNRASQP